MTEDNSNLQIEVRAGYASQTAVGLTANEPVEPFSVGAAGSWQIQADGVADVHAYLFFDGAELFVSSVDPQNPVYANGQPVATDWTPVGPGSEIVLGEARLAVRGPSEDLDATSELQASGWGRSARPKPPTPAPDLDEATMMRPMDSPSAEPYPYTAPDPRKKKLKIRQSARENPHDDGDATRYAPLDAAAPSFPGFKNPPPPGFIGGEGALPPAASTPPPPPAAAPPPGPAPMPWAPPGVSPTAGRQGFAPPGVAPFPGGPPQPGGPPFPGGPPQPSGFPNSGPQPAAALPGPAPITALPHVAIDPRTITTQDTQAKASPLRSLIAQWKNASTPQKAILVLMPFAFASMFVIFDDGDTEASDKPPPTASSSEPAPTPPTPPVKPTASASAPAAPVEPPSDNPDAQPPEAELADGEKTKQRYAADALAAGNDEEALVLYEALAGEHPKETAYKDIVRILRARKNKPANP